MDSPFDIFKKEKDGTMVWIAAVGQLHTAAALVAELSEKYPGEYRVFDKRTGETLPSNEPLQTGCGTRK
jgi:hypothetical protein